MVGISPRKICGHAVRVSQGGQVSTRNSAEVEKVFTWKPLKRRDGKACSDFRVSGCPWKHLCRHKLLLETADPQLPTHHCLIPKIAEHNLSVESATRY